MKIDCVKLQRSVPRAPAAVLQTVNARVAMTCNTRGAALAATNQRDLLNAASTGKGGVYQAVPELAREAYPA